MARLAALGSDHLAALFEGYPAGSEDTTMCRNYFLVLDTAGDLLNAQQVDDPFLDGCYHPHPFGVVSDSAGRLFVAYSPTTSTGAPLVPSSPTFLVAFAHDGTLLWKQRRSTSREARWEPRGVCFFPRGPRSPSRRTPEPRSTWGAAEPHANGPRGGDRGPDGSSGPNPGDVELYGYSTPELQLAWSFGLAAGDTLLSGRKSGSPSWPLNPTQPAQTALLAFATLSGQPSLLALDPESGAEPWACPLGYRSPNPPQMVEISNNGLGLMEGATTCGHCDPPYAGSQATVFRTLSAPGLSPSQEPWTGTFGGAGHPHHESGGGGGSGVN